MFCHQVKGPVNEQDGSALSSACTRGKRQLVHTARVTPNTAFRLARKTDQPAYELLKASSTLTYSREHPSMPSDCSHSGLRAHQQDSSPQYHFGTRWPSLSDQITSFLRAWGTSAASPVPTTDWVSIVPNKGNCQAPQRPSVTAGVRRAHWGSSAQAELASSLEHAGSPTTCQASDIVLECTLWPPNLLSTPLGSDQ